MISKTSGTSQQCGVLGQSGADAARQTAVERATDIPDLRRADEVGLVGRSGQHFELLRDLTRASRFDAEVLLIGETGVGKELYARFVHASSPRSNREFVAINCGAIPEALFENELFGHSAGAYTDAGPRSEGLVAAAEGGTLFLDEVDALPLSSQVKLLRLLQEKEYRRLGDTRLRRANIRIISATNSDPIQAVADRRLREDLYYRLNVIFKRIPPLRERRDDIVVLIHEFTRRYWSQYRSSVEADDRPLQFTEEAVTFLRAHDWPGNVRQLQNLVRSLVCQHMGKMVSCASLPLRGSTEQSPESATMDVESLLGLNFCDAKQRVVDRFEEKYLREMLRRSEGNICQAAQFAGKHRRAFFELLKKHGIEADEFRSANIHDREKQALQIPQPLSIERSAE